MGIFFASRGRRAEHLFASVVFCEAWTFDESVRPLFQVPSCVLLATSGEMGPLLKEVAAYIGLLPERDASPEQAAKALKARKPPSADVGRRGRLSPRREVSRRGDALPAHAGRRRDGRGREVRQERCRASSQEPPEQAREEAME